MISKKAKISTTKIPMSICIDKELDDIMEHNMINKSKLITHLLKDFVDNLPDNQEYKEILKKFKKKK